MGSPDVGFPVAPDLGSEYTLAVSDQRHRAVFNGLWQLPSGFQLSGLYFFGSGLRYATTYGGDLRNTGATQGFGGLPARLRPDCTIVPRNNFVGKPIHRADLRVLRRFAIGGRTSIEGMVEVSTFSIMQTYGTYTTVESSPAYGRPSQNLDVAYQPRMMQLGFRVAF